MRKVNFSFYFFTVLSRTLQKSIFYEKTPNNENFDELYRGGGDNIQSIRTLHVCPYYSKHLPMARKLYGFEKVNEQIKKRINHCNECTLFPFLLLYLDIKEDEVINDESVHGYVIDYDKMPVKNRYGKTEGVDIVLTYQDLD